MEKLLRFVKIQEWSTRWGPPPAALMTLLLGISLVWQSFAQTTHLSPSVNNGGFESGTTGWTFVNATGTNRWAVGAASGPAAGTNAAYVSNDGGTTYTYGNTSTSVSHFYRDIVLPPGESKINLSFELKGNQETFSGLVYDRLIVYAAPTSVTPAPNAPASDGAPGGSALTGATILFSQTANATLYTAQPILVPAIFAGTTMRLIFTWQNDNAGGTPPPASVDNITLTSAVPSNATVVAPGGLWTEAATWAGGVIPTGNDNITVPNGTTLVNNTATTQTVNNFTVNGVYTHFNNGAGQTLNVSGDVTIGATGRALLNAVTGTPSFVHTLAMSGNFINNGFVNANVTTLSWPSSNVGNRSMTGTGTFAGDGTRGFLRTISAQCSGSFTVNTSQSLTLYSALTTTCANIITNNKVRVDNTASIRQNSVQFAIVNASGSGYTTAPVAAATGAANWAAATVAIGDVRINGGNQYVALDAGTASDAPTHTGGTSAAGADGINWLHVGATGVIGNALGAAAFLAAVSGTQYFYNGALYTCVNPANMLKSDIIGVAPFSTTLGATVTIGLATFRCVGSPAQVSVNWDATSQTARTLSITANGTGYSSSPAMAIVNTGAGTGATALSSVYVFSGATSATGTKSNWTTATGTIDIPNAIGPVGAGIVEINSPLGGVFTSPPAVGFSPPSLVNLVQNQGSGYTTAPTITVTGGTLVSGSALLTSDFQISVAMGRIISVYYVGLSSKIYSVPPTLTFAGGGGGSGATLAWGPGNNAYPAATANIDPTTGQITGYTITNAGYGYGGLATTNVGIPPAAALPSTLALGAGQTSTGITVTARARVYNFVNAFFTPATSNPLTTHAAFFPSDGRIGCLSTNAGWVLHSNIEVFGGAPLVNTTLSATANLAGLVDLNTNTITFSAHSYAGSVSTVSNYMYNGDVVLSLPGGQTSATRTFPLGGGVGGARSGVFVTGAGAAPATGGYTYTSIRASNGAAPTGTVSPSGVTTGIRTMRLQMQGSGAITNPNLNKTFQLFWNSQDALVATVASIRLAQASAASGPWTVRTATSAAGTLSAGSRTITNSLPGPITDQTTYFFGFVNDGFTPPPALAYNVAKTSVGTFSSIASTARGGNNSGTPFATWVNQNAPGAADDDEHADLTLPVGFNFNYQGSPVTSIRVHTNGFLQLNNGVTFSSLNSAGNNFASSNFQNVVAPFWEDLIVRAGTKSSSILSSITGSAPNRVLTVEWNDLSIFNAPGPSLTFQVQLFEAAATPGQQIRFNYGDMQLFNGTQDLRYTYSMGLKGGYSSAYPAAGEVFAQQFENFNLFSNAATQLANYGANGLFISPEPRTRFTFTPGAYTPPSAPVATAPANDNQASPEAITALSAFPSNIAWNAPDGKSRIYTTRYSTHDASPAPCGGSATGKDVWFKFTAVETNTQVRIYPSGGFYPRITVYNDDASVQLACVSGLPNAQTSASLTGLTVGLDYLVRVNHEFTGTPATYTGSAIVNGGIVGVSITSGGTGYVQATSTAGAGGPSSLNTFTSGGGGNTWVGAITSVTAGQVTGGGFDGGNNYTSVPSISAGSPDFGITGEFAIVIFAPPINDDCDNPTFGTAATTLTGIGGITCNTGSNQLLGVKTNSATASAETFNPCTSGTDDDLWYKFTATGNRTKLTLTGNNGFDPAAVLYSGATCGTKTQLGGGLACLNSTGEDEVEDLEFATTPGTIYYIRVYHAGLGSGTGPTSEFDICVTTLPDIDVSPKALVSPAGLSCGNPSQNVIVRVQNKGALDLASGATINATATISGPGGPYNLTGSLVLATNLAIADSINVPMSAPFDMSANGTYTFVCTATTSGDGNASNLTLTPSPTVSVNIVPVAPTYANGLNSSTGWTIRQVQLGTGINAPALPTDNWAFVAGGQTNGTPATAIAAREGSGYLFMNSFDFSEATISRAISPCLDLPPGTCNKVSFYFKKDNNYVVNEDEVLIRVSTDGGATFGAPLTLTNRNRGRQERALRYLDTSAAGDVQVWHQYEASLSAYVGQTIRIGIDGVGQYGNNMMVDDFKIEEAPSLDVQPVSLISPAPFSSCGNSIAPVIVRFANNTCFAVTDVPYTVTISGSAAPGSLSGTIPSIAAGTELNVNVGNITINGNNALGITVNTSLAGDEVISNDVLGSIAVPLKPTPVLTASIADPNLVQGFTTTITGSATAGSSDAGYSNATSQNIPQATSDVGPDTRVYVTIPVSINLAANQLKKVAVNILHGFSDDLELELISPQGVIRTLKSSSFFVAGENMTATIFDPLAATSISVATPPYTGSFQPVQNFSTYSATANSATGNWQLRISDNDLPDGGTFLNVSLIFDNVITSAVWSCPTCPPAFGFPSAGTTATPILPAVTYPNPTLGGATFPTGVYPIAFTVDNRQGCTAVENLTLNVFTTNTWLGVNPGSNNWQDPDNWIAAPAPPSNLVAVTIPTGTPNAPNISTSGNVGSIILNTGATVNVASGASLNVGSNITGGTGSFFSNSGSVVLNGLGVQTISGNATFENLTLSKTAGSVQVTGTAVINNLWTISNATSPVNITGAGKVVLKSTPSGTAKLGPVPSGTIISGNVSMERYVPHALTGTGSWFFIGSPISGKNFTDWADNFKAVGLVSGFGAQGGSVLASIQPERSTIFKYSQNVHNVALDTVQKRGWRIPGNENILQGAGYRVWIDKYSNSTSKFDNVGNVFTGTLNFPTLSRNQFPNCQENISPATIACTENWQGWNLLSNPYPCPIDWDATGPGTWTKPSQLNNAVYTWDAVANGYRVHVGTGGNALGVTVTSNPTPNIIPSSQAFFVKLSTPGTYTANLAVSENAKFVASSGNFVRSATSVASNQVRIRMTNLSDINYTFDGMLRFDDNSTYGFDQHLDADALSGYRFDFSFVGDNGENLILNTVPLLTDSKVIPMSMSYTGQWGTYKLEFLETQSISNGAQIYLKDNYLGTLTNINNTSQYSFNAAPNDASSASDRFEIVVSPDAVTGVSKLINSDGLGVYPNPAKTGSNVTLAVAGARGSKASILVVDVLGKAVYTDNMEISQKTYLTEKNLEFNFAPGVYIVKVIAEGKTFTDKLIVR